MRKIVIIIILAILSPVLILSQETDNKNEKRIVAEYTDLNGVTYVRHEGDRFWKCITETDKKNPVLTNEMKPGVNVFVDQGTIVMEYYDSRNLLAPKNDAKDNLDIHEDFELNTFEVYPNPSNNELKFNFILEKKGTVEISIFEYNGQNQAVLLKQEFEAGSHTVNVDVSEFAKNEYFIGYKVHGKKIGDF